MVSRSKRVKAVHWTAFCVCLEIHYERIVHDQEKQTQSLLDFLRARLGRGLPYSDSIDRWKRYGNKLEILREALGNWRISKKRPDTLIRNNCV